MVSNYISGSNYFCFTMAIKNLDGTVFRLRGPNPLMIDQDRWNMDEIVLHNMTWEPVLFPGGKQSSITPKPEPPPAIPTESPMTQPTAVPIDSKPPEPEEQKGMVKCHCLPLHQRKIKDDFYQADYTMDQFGYPFEFTVGMVSDTDVQAAFWTAREDISEGSVLFPKDNKRRWWRVERVAHHGVGCMLYCTPSDYQPSFD